MNGQTNKQGRAVSDSMRLAAFKRYLATVKPAPEFRALNYRGFEVSGGKGRWFLSRDPRVFTSKTKALAAVDSCLALRAEVAS